jgi:hypothetical protein
VCSRKSSGGSKSASNIAAYLDEGMFGEMCEQAGNSNSHSKRFSISIFDIFITHMYLLTCSYNWILLEFLAFQLRQALHHSASFETLPVVSSEDLFIGSQQMFKFLNSTASFELM